MKIAKDRPVGEDKRKKPIVEKKVVQSVSNTTKISPDALDTSAVQSTFKEGGIVSKGQGQSIKIKHTKII
jgi:hypothetical protein